jgi:hypothetical protein
MDGMKSANRIGIKNIKKTGCTLAWRGQCVISVGLSTGNMGNLIVLAAVMMLNN